MTMSLKKLGSTFTNLTVNRGVEAKEIEIGNTQLDVDTSSSSRTLTESGALAAGDAPRPASPLLLSDQSASFIQVVVQKHRTGQTRTRLPAASSPAAAQPAAAIFTSTFPIQKTMHENNSVPTAVLLACPAYTALDQQSWDKVLSCVNKNTMASEALHRASGDAPCVTKNQEDKKNKRTTKKMFWKKTNGPKKEDLDLFEDAPERLEVYRVACAPPAPRAPPARLQRAARRLARPAAAALRELLAAPRLLVDALVAVVIQVERCVLESVRGAVCGAAAAAADAALLPALAAAAATARAALLVAAPAAAAAARALTAALDAALAPPARLLAALRLVHVERACHCAPARRHQCTQV